MSTTDTRSAFEEWAKRTHRRPGTHFDKSFTGQYKDNRIAAKWAAWQAATEAAKATGTAGELSDEEILKIQEKHIPKHGWSTNGLSFARDILAAARQPAPVVAVKTWKQRLEDLGVDTGDGIDMDHPIINAMKTEIAGLRAALAATNRSQP